MLHDYSKSAPITEAIERTFSGDYPCTMCTKISEGQQKEEKAPRGFCITPRKGSIQDRAAREVSVSIRISANSRTISAA